ncbi:hypothetical protein FHL15_009878 [Xylaria flabelliformis]|uniref:Rhodopsin domain-containing protein n=1 Tax=Xylaria flabelliformis TaxID=2512241 RepID=A0A553HMJ3_9PEZI|nr:hypothetical protein FHL15_009878 [Xylaria flabelliformis]
MKSRSAATTSKNTDQQLVHRSAVPRPKQRYCVASPQHNVTPPKQLRDRFQISAHSMSDGHMIGLACQCMINGDACPRQVKDRRDPGRASSFVAHYTAAFRFVALKRMPQHPACALSWFSVSKLAPQNNRWRGHRPEARCRGLPGLRPGLKLHGLKFGSAPYAQGFYYIEATRFRKWRREISGLFHLRMTSCTTPPSASRILTARHLRRTRLSADDWLCFAGLLIGYTCCALQLYAAIDGQLGQHQRLGPDGQPILDDPRFLVFERTKLAVNVLSPIGFGLVKASIVVLYEGIFHNIRPFRYSAYVMLGLLFAWSLSFFFANLFICFPVTALIEPFYGKKCVDRAAVFLSTLVTDLIFDILILLMPIPVVLRLHLPRKDRFGVLGMFLLGATQVPAFQRPREHKSLTAFFSVVAVSIARLAQLLEVNSQYLKFAYDQTYYTSPAFFWANIELSVAVVSACLPTLKPVLSFFFPSPPKPQTKQTDYIKITERQTSHSRGSRGSDNYSTEPGKGSIPLDAYEPEP